MAGARTNFLTEQFDPLLGPDLRMRHFIGGNRRAIEYNPRYGLLTDNSTLAGRVEGNARFAGGNYNNRFVGSGMAQTNFGGGNTPSNPGGYNWNTLERNLGRAAEIGLGVVSYRMQDKRLASAKARHQQQEQLDSDTPMDDPLSPNTPPMPSPSSTTGTGGRKRLRLPRKNSPLTGPQPPAPPTIPVPF